MAISLQSIAGSMGNWVLCFLSLLAKRIGCKADYYACVEVGLCKQKRYRLLVAGLGHLRFGINIVTDFDGHTSLMH